MSSQGRTSWPDGKDFAFTIFDDTDFATLENVAPVYDLLGRLGFHTTKSVWAISGAEAPRIGGATCEDSAYRSWTLGLEASGFEIGSHGATFVTSPRAEVIRALDRFREIYGHDPFTLANHSGCAELIYWGADRVGCTARLAYNAMTGFRRRGVFRGHLESDPLFWGDLCRDRVRYVRNFTFDNVNTLAACPVMPYHDPERPFVNRWFASSEGADVAAFNRCCPRPIKTASRPRAGLASCIRTSRPILDRRPTERQVRGADDASRREERLVRARGDAPRLPGGAARPRPFLPLRSGASSSGAGW